jgi:hypothetical protein
VKGHAEDGGAGGPGRRSGGVCQAYGSRAGSACNSSPGAWHQALAGVPAAGRPDGGPGHSVAGIAIYPGVVWLAGRSLRAYGATLRSSHRKRRFLHDLTPTRRLRHVGEKDAGSWPGRRRGF